MIEKRGKSYAVRVYVGKENGKSKYRWVGSFSTRRDAAQAERDALNQPLGLGGETCDKFADRWLRDYARPSPVTQLTYKGALKRFRQDFQGVKLRDVQAARAYAWARQQPESTVRVVRTMFYDALKHGYVPTNPFANLGLPTSPGRRNIQTISEEELNELADAALAVHGPHYGPMFRALVLFAGFVGARSGEIFALELSDLDLGNEEVDIRQSVNGFGTIVPPKNGRTRTVVLPPQVTDALRQVHPLASSGLVFTTPRGKQFTKSQFARYWHPVRAAAGFPKMQFHELRHFCATWLLDHQVSTGDVALQLGHTDGGTLVRKLYGHPSVQLARQRLKRAYRKTKVISLQRKKRRKGDAKSG